jgi:hypothetical protein
LIDKLRGFRLVVGAAKKVHKEFGVKVTITIILPKRRKMTFHSKIVSLVLVAFLGLQGCAVYDTTSPSFRVLSQPVLVSITPQMQKSEVLMRLGEPWREVTYTLKPAETYVNWRWRDAWNRRMIFSAVLDPQGRVIRTENWPDPEGRRSIGGYTTR